MMLAELRYRVFFFLGHLGLVVLAVLLKDMLDLGDRNNGEEFREQKVTGKKQTERAHIKSYFPDGRSIISAPGRRKVIAIYRGHDNHKALEPHTDINEDRPKEGYEQIAAHLAEPEDLRR